jgi:predicted dehydrogenase
MNNILNFGIVGCGVIAPCHASAIKNMEGANLYAVCDIIPEKADEFAGKYEVGHIYYDYKEMLKDPAIDVVCVCVPSGIHGEISKAAARAGKHIVCEKPMEITPEKIEDVIKVVRECGVKMQCIFQRRTMSAAIAVKKAVQEGKFGKIVLADAYLKYYRSQEYYNSAGWRGTWELDGGGALMNQGVHGIDLLAWMVGEKINKVFAKAGTLARNIVVEDTAVAMLQFAGGGYGVIEGTTSTYPGFETKFEIHGEKGTVIFDDSGIKTWEFIGDDAPEMPEASEKLGGASDPAKISSVGHYILIKDLVDAINEDREPMIPPEEARTAVGLICTIYKSSQEKKELDFQK